MACKIIEFIEIAGLGTTVSTHALIAFDRYRCLARPYLPKMETRVVKKVIILSWVIPAFVSSPYLYMLEVPIFESKIHRMPNTIPIKWLDKLYSTVEFVTVLLIPFLVIYWCYFHVVRMMWRGTPLVSSANALNPRHSVTFTNRKRVTRTAGLCALIFTVFWFPTFIINFILIVSDTERAHSNHPLQQIALFCTQISEATNPIIYCAFDKNVQETLIRMRAI